MKEGNVCDTRAPGDIKRESQSWNEVHRGKERGKGHVKLNTTNE